MRRFVSIKQKLQAIILLITAVVLLLSISLFMAVEINTARQESVENLRTLAKVLGDNSSAAILFRDNDTAREVLASLASQDSVAWGGIILGGGELFAEYRSASFTPRQLPPGDELTTGFFAEHIRVDEPIYLHKEFLGTFRIIGDMREAHALLWKQAAVGTGIFIVSMLLALLLSSRLQRLITVPVQRLLDATQRVGTSKDFSTRAQRLSNDELGILVDGFNLMLDRLQSYDRELANYSQDLEGLVEERTRDLKAATQQAEAANQAKSDFLATMSHEIRTPMNSVLGFASLLDKSTLDGQQKSYLHNISSSAESLLTIIDDILDFSKMESGKLSLEFTDFSLRAMIDDIRALFGPMAEEKGLNLAIILDETVPEQLHGDPVRLRQIVVNLVANAVKFTERGGVTLKVEGSTQEDGGILMKLTVEDSGIGIPPEQQAMLFQPFQQCDASITRRYGGTGLGLVITRRLVTLMGGEITFTSTQGVGTQFTVIVPLAAPQSSGAAPLPSITYATSGEEASLAGLSILVVDDNELNLTVANTLLSDEGADVVSVGSAAAALREATTRHFDIVLMDLEMPEVSGVEAAEQLRASPDVDPDLPIIALTAHAFAEKRQEVLAAGMNDLLTKPYKPEQLFAVITRWSGRGGIAEAATGEYEESLPSVVYSQEAALAAVGGDESLARQLLAKFLELLPESEAAIRNASNIGDNVALYEAVHKLVGSASIIGAMSLYAEAARLQDLLKGEPPEPQTLATASQALLQAIANFRNQAPGSLP